MYLWNIPYNFEIDPTPHMIVNILVIWINHDLD